METISLIVSSGVISVLVSLVTITLMIGKYKEKVDTQEKHIEKHDGKISLLSDRVSKLEGGIDRDRASIDEFIRRKSPLSLTEKGKALLLDSKGKDFIDNNKDRLLEAVHAKNPKTAYDVQEFSKKVLEELSTNDIFNPIKDFAFKQGLKLDILISVMGIYLRDMVLPLLGFSITDIKD